MTLINFANLFSMNLCSFKMELQLFP